MGILTSLIVLAAGQPDPAAPGNAEPWTPTGWGTVVAVAIIGVVVMIANYIDHDRDREKSDEELDAEYEYRRKL